MERGNNVAITWLRSIKKLEIWLKGIYTPEGVILAINYNVDGIIISNHGGRHLDDVPATLDALEEYALITAGQVPIAIYGGIQRGSDIFKAIALCAQHCFCAMLVVIQYNAQEVWSSLSGSS
ncbi:hypothetical protein ETB97_001981 [Aspergillus alliaceus]|uniref:FMN hydroxy acid dehydrogenase domain-containing protein n=1 Tax=Petromyces alliaceus TaxID=209559 RepID=A0A8H6AAM8_PETAA|nr:hypothetical protein ETB97_001981 [Aspergillus burnettii]